MTNNNTKANKMTHYDDMWQKFQSGEISEAAWREFCDSLLDTIMNDHKDMFVRMFYR